MSGRNAGAAEAAASAASEAARVLQARQQESRQSAPEPTPEPAAPENVPKPARETLRSTKKPDDEPQATPNRKRGNADRDAVMADIRRARGEQTISAPEPEQPKAEEPKVEAAPAASTAAPEPVAVEPTSAAPAPAIPAAETVRVKVDGDEYDAPKAEVDEAGGVHAYQRDKAAENRLRKANETLAEARRIAASMHQTQQPTQPVVPRPTDKDVIAKLAAARFGTDEEYSAAVEEALSRGRVDPNGIVQQAVNEMQKAQAMAGFQQEFGDVAQNPMALRLAVSLENEVYTRIQQAQQQGQLKGPLDWQKIYRTIGTQVRNAFGGTARQSQPAAPNAAAATTAATQPGNPSPVSEKEARKATIVTLPTAAARAAPTEEPKPETREESLNRMRARRGLPTV